MAGVASGLAAAATGTACGTSATATPPGPGGTLGLGIVGLLVHDLQRSLDFYRTLWLAIPRQVSGDNFRLTLPNGQVFFWDSDTIVRSFDPKWTPGSGGRRVVLEFGFATADAVDAMYRRLVAEGHPSYFEAQDLYGARYAIVLDPDGNQVSLRYPLSS